MRKIMVFILIFMLFGCTRQEEPPQTNTATPTVSPTIPAKETPTPKTVKPQLLSSAQTELLDKGENRISNIRLAISAFEDCVIKPGELFSFNDIVGERSEDRGYKKAAVIIHGKKDYEHGGGVCQVSSTIYQAVKKTDLNVLERHNHDKNVGYVKMGEDAAVDYDFLDFKFENNTDNPIKIVIFCDDMFVTAEIYGISDQKEGKN